MKSKLDSYFYPSLGQQSSWKNEIPALLTLCAILLLVTVIGYMTLDLDHPFRIATTSRAVYVDGGFYSDAAQNWAKFGQWSFEYDSRHWPGVPFLAVFRSQIFGLFGVSLETARMSSIYLSVLGLIAFYLIIRTSLKPYLAVALTLAAALTVSYTAHARSALAEPTATCFALLAILVFVRVKNKNIAIPLSIGLAFISSLSKLYFLHALASMVVLWSIELVILPLITKRNLEKHTIIIFGTSLLGVTTVFLLGIRQFPAEIATYLSYNTAKVPNFDPVTLIGEIPWTLSQLGMQTKAHLFLWTITVCLILFVGIFFLKGKRIDFKKITQKFGRAEVAMLTWIVVGLVMITIIRQQKTQYYFFAILPLCFLGAVSLKLIIPDRFQTVAISGLIFIHILFQVPYYYEWSQRIPKTAMVDASRDMTKIIHQQSDSSIIPVMGEFSAQLALYSDRMLSLDAKWGSLPNIPFCQRIKYWRPSFHVNIVRGHSRALRRLDAYKKCNIVSHIQEVKRYLLYPPREEILLTRIYYRQ